VTEYQQATRLLAGAQAMMLPVGMDDLTVTGNQIEAVLWFAFSAGFIIRAICTTGGHRRLAFRDVAEGERLARLIGAVLRPVRGILFDKTASENWSVSWHQDRFGFVESSLGSLKDPQPEVHHGAGATVQIA